MRIFSYIFQDWKANKGNLKGRYILLSFRIASLLERSVLFKYLFFPLYLHHKIWVSWIMGVELQSKVRLGTGCKLFHGQGLVINSNVEIGNNVILRHSTTIGNKIGLDGKETKCPKVGDNCEIGAHVVIIGPIKIGNNVTIAAMSLVNKDVPDNSIVAGIPAKIIAIKQDGEV